MHLMYFFFVSFLTPLHIAADKSHYDVMDILLKHGAKVTTLILQTVKRECNTF